MKKTKQQRYRQVARDRQRRMRFKKLEEQIDFLNSEEARLLAEQEQEKKQDEETHD